MFSFFLSPVEVKWLAEVFPFVSKRNELFNPDFSATFDFFFDVNKNQYK